MDNDTITLKEVLSILDKTSKEIVKRDKETKLKQIEIIISIKNKLKEAVTNGCNKNRF